MRTAARRAPTGHPIATAFVGLASCVLLALAPADATAADARPRDLASVTTSVEREIETILDETGIPSISIALIRDGQVVWASAHGYANVGARVPATVDTYYSTASTFKFVTATAVMQLVERGALTLDTPVNEIVGPELAVEGADDVTVRHLLSHTSALDAFAFARRSNPEGPVTSVPLWGRQPSITPEELLSNARRTGPPGIAFDYCNDCYAIAGYIVEIVSGQSYDEYVAEHVLQPLGIDIDRPSVPSPRVVEHMALPYDLSDNAPTPIAQVRGDAFAAGDVYLKASDMARFVAAQLSGGEYAGGRILSAASTEEMRRQQFADRAYGLGVQMASFEGHDVIHHSGGMPGYKSIMVAEPSTRQGVYIMANAPSVAISELARYAMQLMWGDDVEPLPSFATKTEVARQRANGEPGVAEVVTDVAHAAADETAIPAGLPEAATLFARHLQARGGRTALEKAETIEVIGKIAIPAISLEGAMRARFGRDLHFTSTVVMGIMGTTRQGYDGKVGWSITPQGGTEVLDGARLEQLKREANWLADAEYEQLYTEMRTVAREDFHGFDCFVVEVTSAAGDASRIYFEQATGLARGRDGTTETAAGPTQIITVIHTYGEFDDLLIATRTEVIVPGKKMSPVMTVETVEYDTLEPGVFELPPGIVAKVEG